MGETEYLPTVERQEEGAWTKRVKKGVYLCGSVFYCVFLVLLFVYLMAASVNGPSVPTR